MTFGFERKMDNIDKWYTDYAEKKKVSKISAIIQYFFLCNFKCGACCRANDRYPTLTKLTKQAELQKKIKNDLIESEKGDIQKYKSKSIFTKTKMHWMVLIVISIFYSLPSVQFVVEKNLQYLKTGNEDLCFYNHKCMRRVGYHRDFNHLFSNIGYIIFGLLFIFLVKKRRQQEEKFEEEKKKFKECCWAQATTEILNIGRIKNSNKAIKQNKKSEGNIDKDILEDIVTFKDEGEGKEENYLEKTKVGDVEQNKIYDKEENINEQNRKDEKDQTTTTDEKRTIMEEKNINDEEKIKNIKLSLADSELGVPRQSHIFYAMGGALGNDLFMLPVFCSVFVQIFFFQLWRESCLVATTFVQQI